MPSKYQNKVCGLCGNYNDNRSDDTLTKKGRAVDTPERFFNSWRVILMELLFLSLILSFYNTFNKLSFLLCLTNCAPIEIFGLKNVCRFKLTQTCKLTYPDILGWKIGYMRSKVVEEASGVIAPAITEPVRTELGEESSCDEHMQCTKGSCVQNLSQTR